MIDFFTSEVIKLTQDHYYSERVISLLLEDEVIIDAYKTMHDGVIFTNKRIIMLRVQITDEHKYALTSLPYKNIVAYSIETTGRFDVDAELGIYFSNLGQLRFEFIGSTQMPYIAKAIARHVL